jgi:hypothetical protein
MIKTNADKMRQLHLQALRLLAEPCWGKTERFHARNCQHCELRKNNPNYSGWARIYVQARKVVRNKQAKAFLKELESDNLAYRNALKADIECFGLTISKN